MSAGLQIAPANSHRLSPPVFITDTARREFTEISTKKMFMDLYGTEDHGTIYNDNWSMVCKYNASLAQAGNKDAYFMVNSFENDDRRRSSKDKLMRINAFFIDIDAPKKKVNGQEYYSSRQEVEAYKCRVVEILLNRSLPVSYAWETRNGIQALWIIDNRDRDRIGEWQCIQQYIINDLYKDIADGAVVDVRRVLRRPDSTWYKRLKRAREGRKTKLVTSVPHAYENGLVEPVEPFECQMVWAMGRQYRLDEFEYTPEIQENNQIDMEPQLRLIVSEQSERRATCIDKIKKRDSTYFLRLLNNPQPRNMSRGEFERWIKHQDMRQFLGIQEKGAFSCIFHADEHPSARILEPNEEHRYYAYFCDSPKCGDFKSKPLTLIDVIMMLQGCSFTTALDFLGACYDITILHGGGNESGIKASEAIDNLKQAYRLLSRRIGAESLQDPQVKNIIGYMLKTLTEAIKRSKQEYYADCLYTPIAKRLLADKIGASETKTFCLVKYLAYIGFVEPMGNDELDFSKLSPAYRAAIREQMIAYNGKSMQFYRLPLIRDVKAFVTEAMERLLLWEQIEARDKIAVKEKRIPRKDALKKECLTQTVIAKQFGEAVRKKLYPLQSASATAQMKLVFAEQIS